MNISITEAAVKNHLNMIGDGEILPAFLNIPFELDNGNQGNYKIKSNIDRLNKLLKQLKVACKLYGKRKTRIKLSTNSPDNTIENQAAFYVNNLKTSVLLFYPLKGSMLSTSNQFRLLVLARIVPRSICRGGNYSSDVRYLSALTDAAIDIGYTIKEYNE